MRFDKLFDVYSLMRERIYIRIVEGLTIGPLTTTRTNLKEKEEMSRE